MLFRFGNRTEASILRSIRLIYTVCGMSNDGWPMAPTICRLGDAMRTTQMVAVRIICSLTAEIIYPIYRQRNSHGWDYSNATYIPLPEFNRRRSFDLIHSHTARTHA